MQKSRERGTKKYQERKRAELRRSNEGSPDNVKSPIKTNIVKPNPKGRTNQPLKRRKCKNCPNRFIPFRPLQQACSPACAIVLGRKLIEKQEANKWKTIKNGLKTMSFYEKKLQNEVNTIARLIDYGQTCISCNKNGKPQAGHRHSIGANKTIRFNLHNLHFQDYRCNVELSGNPDNYDKGLTEKYGQQYQEYVNQTLVCDYPVLKWSKDELIEATAKARKIIRDYQHKILEAKERIEIRTKFNKEIGIYK